MQIINPTNLVEGKFYWITVVVGGLQDIGYWDGYKFIPCLAYESLAFLEVREVYPVCLFKH